MKRLKFIKVEQRNAVGKCRECGRLVNVSESTCEYCGCSNPGA